KRHEADRTFLVPWIVAHDVRMHGTEIFEVFRDRGLELLHPGQSLLRLGLGLFLTSRTAKENRLALEENLDRSSHGTELAVLRDRAESLLLCQMPVLCAQPAKSKSGLELSLDIFGPRRFSLEVQSQGHDGVGSRLDPQLALNEISGTEAR